MLQTTMDTVRASSHSSTPRPEQLGYHVDFSSCCILVVDDSFLSRELIDTCLKDAGYQNVLLAENGQEALELLEDNSPDLVILDLVMPVLDGYATCEELRRRDDTRNVPILIQSGHDKPEDVRRAFEAGASDMIGKPFRRVELLSRIQVHLENRILLKDLLTFRRRIAQELEDAREMQQILCPGDDLVTEIARRHGLDIGRSYQPSSELGGDIWGMFEADSEHVCVYLADFAGHGVAAALNTFRLHTLIARLGENVLDPARTLALLNDDLCSVLRPGQFSTLIWVCIERGGGLTYASAGAPPPIVWDGEASGVAVLGQATGLPLGFVPDIAYENHRLAFPTGSRFFMYSDAIIEAEAEGFPPLGEDGLLRLMAGTQGDSSQAVVDAALSNFLAQLGDAPNDDLTTVLIAADPSGRARASQS